MRLSQLLITLGVIIVLPGTIAADPPSETERNRALKPGWLAYQRGDLAEALSVYQSVSTAYPHDASLWYDLGCLYALTHDAAQARSAFLRSLLLNPRLASAYDALGQLSEQEGEVVAAHALYTSAVTLEGRRGRFLRHLSRVLFRLNEVGPARRALQELLNVDPDDVDARYRLGVLELWANEPDLAIIDFQHVVKRTPDHVMAWNGLAMAYARIGSLEEATRALERAKRLDPTDAHTLTNLGVLAAYEERWDEALDAWHSTLEHEPGFTPAVKNLETLNALTTTTSQ